jgi:hypothetical protein
LCSSRRLQKFGANMKFPKVLVAVALFGAPPFCSFLG